MSTNIVMTVAGPDRIGIVDEVTSVIDELGGNVETSRMARLGGEFVMVMLLAVPEDRIGDLESNLAYLAEHDYNVSMRATRKGQTDAHPGWSPFRIQVQGADHEGIIHRIAEGLAGQGISIDVMDSWVTRAPMSGTGLFSMMALVVVPPSVVQSEWLKVIGDIAEETGVEIEITAPE